MIRQAHAFNIARVVTAILAVAVLVPVGFGGQPPPVEFLLDVAVALIVIVYVTRSAAAARMLGDAPPPSFFLRRRSASRDLGFGLLLLVTGMAATIGVIVGCGLDRPGRDAQVLTAVIEVPATFLAIAALLFLGRAVVTSLRALYAWANSRRGSRAALGQAPASRARSARPAPPLQSRTVALTTTVASVVSLSRWSSAHSASSCCVP